jgi:hypothetical protein
MPDLAYDVRAAPTASSRVVAVAFAPFASHVSVAFAALSGSGARSSMDVAAMSELLGSQRGEEDDFLDALHAGQQHGHSIHTDAETARGG